MFFYLIIICILCIWFFVGILFCVLSFVIERLLVIFVKWIVFWSVFFLESVIVNVLLNVLLVLVVFIILIVMLGICIIFVLLWKWILLEFFVINNLFGYFVNKFLIGDVKLFNMMWYLCLFGVI